MVVFSLSHTGSVETTAIAIGHIPDTLRFFFLPCCSQFEQFTRHFLGLVDETLVPAFLVRTLHCATEGGLISASSRREKV